MNYLIKAKIEEISDKDLQYIVYDNYLKKNYFTSIEENEDFIPYKNNKEVFVIFNNEIYEQLQYNEVFDCLSDYL